jgi:hypothetical protein
MPQTYFPQPPRGFGGFGGISSLPPSAAPFSLSEIFQPYLGKVPTFGKTFPGFFPSSIPIKTPSPTYIGIKTFLDDLPIPNPDLKESGLLKYSAPGDSIPSEGDKL